MPLVHQMNDGPRTDTCAAHGRQVGTRLRALVQEHDQVKRLHAALPVPMGAPDRATAAS